ncbi:phosphatase PAP2 family protein [Roseibium salinum]|nr:phosphatase PAP2 family protein [Roseibium salinum]
MIGEVAPGEPMVRADIAIRNLFDSLRTPGGDRIMVFMTTLGDGIVVTFATGAVAAYLFLRKAWRRGTGFVIAMAGTALFVPLLKLMLHRSRPMELYTGADAYSLPSGHATLNAVLFGICAVLVAHDLSRWAKAAIFTVTATLVITIGFSRVYLGAHWMSDVLAGLLFRHGDGFRLRLRVRPDSQREDRPDHGCRNRGPDSCRLWRLASFTELPNRPRHV